jgi:hypothetical protein
MSTRTGSYRFMPVTRVLDGAFTEFGIPDAIRTDNGPPFASTGAGGLTELSVWWLQLGIHVERIQPGKPQQNSRQERLHRTLEEVVGIPAANPRAQQRAIDVWRRQYNEVRPHEALQLRTPDAVYERARRRYPCKLRDTRDTPHDLDEVYRLDKHGRLRWRRQWIHISNAFAYAYVGVWPSSDDWTLYDVHFAGIPLGTFDANHLARGLRIPRRRRLKAGEVPGCPWIEVSTLSVVAHLPPTYKIPWSGQPKICASPCCNGRPRERQAAPSPISLLLRRATRSARRATAVFLFLSSISSIGASATARALWSVWAGALAGSVASVAVRRAPVHHGAQGGHAFSTGPHRTRDAQKRRTKK